MRLFANLPFGGGLYKASQKRFGRLRAEPMERLPAQAEMVKWLLGQEFSLTGANCLEVGTGHIPLVPIGFFLCGAAKTITIDTHRRLDLGLTRGCLAWIAQHREEVEILYDGLIAAELLDQRLSLLVKWKDQPERFLKEAGIQYLSPADAANTGLAASSIDCHISTTVLEHISEPGLRSIFTEARRLLAHDGKAIHFIDLSDHFQHQDKSITQINFLRFSEREWNRIAGNEFAYCNRLRASNYMKLFKSLGFVVERVEELVDQPSLDSLRSDFLVDPQFNDYENEDLSVTTLKIMLHAGES